MSRSKRFLFLLLPLALGAFSCSSSPHHLVYAYGYGTTWEIHLYEGKKSDAEEIEEYIRVTSMLLDPEAKHSSGGLYALNHEGEVMANPFLMEAYELAEQVRLEVGEGYSYTMGELTSAWEDSLEKGEVLAEISRQNLLENAKNTSVRKEGNLLIKSGPGQVDFGSLGKGLCLRHIQKTLEEKGIEHYLINGGTSSLLIGKNHSPSGATKITLSDAKGYYFPAVNCAVSTSSITRESHEIDGVSYSHILDPRNGMAHVDYDACCLKGEDPAYLDALSTALIVLGPEAGKEYEKKGIAVSFVKEGEIVYASEGFLQKE